MIQKIGTKSIISYSAASLFTLVFGQIYTHFGHGVTSVNMTWAFVPSLVGAALFVLFAFVDKLPCPKGYTAMSFGFAVTAYTLDMIIRGVLDIAGAYSHYEVIMLVTALVFTALFALLYLKDIICKEKS